MLCDLASIYIFNFIIISLTHYSLYTSLFFPFPEQYQGHFHVGSLYLLPLQLTELFDKVFIWLVPSFNSNLRLNTAHLKRHSLATLFFIICLLPVALLVYETETLSDLLTVVSMVPRTMAGTNKYLLKE